LFKVTWKGESAATWEPRSKLTDCQDLLEEFEKNYSPKKKTKKSPKKSTSAATEVTVDDSLYDASDSP
jgi:hypothetical protein